MSVLPNHVLVEWMHDQQLSSRELAELVNGAVAQLTGRHGGLDDSNIRAWRSGRVRCPKNLQLRALELVSGKSATDLGFERRTRTPATAPAKEDPPVLRRHLIQGAAAIAATAATPSYAASPRIGVTDVERLQQRFADVVASDHRHGGQQTIEQQAAALSEEALRLQASGAASQRVRGYLYASAAAFRSSAMWAAIDGRRYNRAIEHMREAQQLAAMSGDQAIQFRIWSHAGTMYRHMKRPADAAAANDVARTLAITRRDPMFASLGHARHAAIHATAGDLRATRRALDTAQEAMQRADPDADRPVWMRAFYDQAELDSLALSAFMSLAQYDAAEAHAHRCLASLRPHMHRSRAITTSRLALAQLGQGDLEPAVTSAMRVPRDAATSHPRVVEMLATLGSELRKNARTSPQARLWTEYARSLKGTAK
ncbi:XRE family transcriptional regulator [Streptomyces sp. NPDC058290]|uniref:XRE family transcriptional regulator n=1 Tax=Streptomyces sp. NPDC058290 TaxID=3346426 RepID=UPI0036EF9169